MMETDSASFFDTLPRFTAFEGVADTANYAALPADWALATADIVDSTGAIADGRYKAVNMAGASVISAILNALDEQQLPFVFGGDGALVAVPPAGISKARAALAAVRIWVAEELRLDMRTALVPVADINAAGREVRVARYEVSPGVSYAMFSGGGASWAEERMKDGQFLIPPAEAGARPDLTGLSCRWNPIRARHGDIVSIITVPTPQADDAAFRALISDILAIAAGEERDGHPVGPDGPELGLSREGLDTEAKAAAPKGGRLRAKVNILVQYLLTTTLFRLGVSLGGFSARRYKQDVARNTDFRKFDDGLKMTLDVDKARMARIEARLRAAEADGICRYGLHRQDAALMTCIVPTPLSRDHMHFIDGAAGGYAMAARQLKRATQAEMLTP